MSALMRLSNAFPVGAWVAAFSHWCRRGSAVAIAFLGTNLISPIPCGRACAVRSMSFKPWKLILRDQPASEGGRGGLKMRHFRVGEHRHRFRLAAHRGDAVPQLGDEPIAVGQVRRFEVE